MFKSGKLIIECLTAQLHVVIGNTKKRHIHWYPLPARMYLDCNIWHIHFQISSQTDLQGIIYAQIRKAMSDSTPLPLPPSMLCKTWRNRVGREKRENRRISCKNMLLFCIWEYSGVSNWEAAYSLCSKSLQSLKVSNIWALPLNGSAM